MRQLLAFVEFRRRAMEATTASLWQIAACFAFNDGTFDVKDMYDACTEYNSDAFNTGATLNIYQVPPSIAPSVSSIDLTAEEAPPATEPEQQATDPTPIAETASVAATSAAHATEAAAPDIAAASASSSSAQPTQLSSLDPPSSLAPPVSSDSAPNFCRLSYQMQVSAPPTHPSPAASTKNVLSAKSTPNVSPRKTGRGTHSREASKLQKHAAPSLQARMTTVQCITPKYCSKRSPRAKLHRRSLLRQAACRYSF